VSRRQIQDLPLNGRNPIELIRLQAGVAGIPARQQTTINGGRPTWTQVTQDGINIQDNFIRTNSLDFVPNRPTSDTISEFTITTNTQGADAAGGASQVKLVTPSGASDFHGALYEFNRNSALAANSFFNNKSVNAITGQTTPRPFLNRNQFGGNIGGPVLVPKKVFGPLGGWNDNKDKLFFFFTYEGFRQRTATTQNNTIPATADYLQGVFRYVRPSDGTVQAVNVINALPGLNVDPVVQQRILSQMPSSTLVNNYDTGNSTAARILNTAGYRFNQSDANDRNQYAFRFDYQPTLNHRFEFTHQRFKETDDRTDIDLVSAKPIVYTDSDVKFVVGAWRWTLTPKLNNELRIGFNLAPVAFESTGYVGNGFFATPTLTQRQVTFAPQGRDTRTYQYIDNASYVTGNHSFQFGGSLQQIKGKPYNYAGQIPTVTFGFSNTAPVAQQLTAANFPGGSISAQDLAAANLHRAFLAGVITQVAQTFQVANKTSGYVSGLANVRDFYLNNWALYAQDNWRLRSNLTLRYGLKWEYFSPLKEKDDLQLLPVLNGRNVETALKDPNTLLDYTNGGFYEPDRNNFGPTVGIAWDPFKDGKTSVRAGYTMAFVNEETLTVARNAGNSNAGLSSAATAANLYTQLANGVPVIPTPTFKVPRSLADQLLISPTASVLGLDSPLKQPYVHQVSFSVEREIGLNIAVEARYVGTMGRDIWRGIEINQVNTPNEFYQDFLRARSNGFLALNTPATAPGCTTATCGVFNPAYNAALTGSQQLTVLTGTTFGGGSLTNATVRSNIQTGQMAALAAFYLGAAGAAVGTTSRAYFTTGTGNPGIYSSQFTLNGGETDYHSLQLEARRRFSGGIGAQANYTFSKNLTNSAGTSQQRFEPYLDNNRQELEHIRAEFDLTHVINASVTWELPFGKGHRWASSNGTVDRIVGGWQIGSIIHYQSGAPFSILSGRQTFNRVGTNPASSSLSADQIKALFGIRKQANGIIYYIDPAVINTDGRAVGADNATNTAGFSGQVFFNPSAGQIGQLAKLQFDGPSTTQWDFSVIKRTRISESTNFELRFEFFNFLNHTNLFVGDQDINSANFGRISSSFGSRVIQIAGKFNF
jgi:hypothetical protein